MGYLKKPLSILQKKPSLFSPPGRKGAPFSFFLQSFYKWVGSFRPSIYAILCLRSWSCWAKGSCRGAAVKRWFPPFHWSREGLLPRPIIDRDFTDAEGSLLTKPPTWVEKLVARKKRRGSEARQCKTRVCTGRGYLEVIIWTRLLFRYLIWPEWEEIKQGGVDVSSQFLLVWVGPTRRGWFRTLGSEETNLLNNENMLWFLHVAAYRKKRKKRKNWELAPT